MKLEELTVENIKGIKWIDIDFRALGHAIIIAGKNGAGKSSVIDAVQYLFAGSRGIPDDVIRHGATSGEINATLEDGTTITKKFTPKGVRVSLKDANGVPIKSPQTILNKLVEGENGGKPLLFDPNKFATLPSKEMLEMLKDIIGVDTTQLDQQYKIIYDERTDLNRDLKRLKARREAIVINTEEMDYDELYAERTRRQQAHDQARARKLELDTINASIERLKEQLATEEERKRQILEQPAPILLPIEEIDQKLDEARKAKQAREEATQLDEEILAAQQAVEEHTGVLETIKESKKDMLSKIEKFPIKGLAVTEDGITINGVPPENLSQGEKLRLGIAAAIAMQPELKILLVRDASLLDNDSLQQIIEDAEKHNTTILLEVVSDQPHSSAQSIFISNGEWIEQRKQSEKDAAELEAALM